MDWKTQLAKVQANKPVKPEMKPAIYCLWFYKIDNQCGYTRMGLMTNKPAEAQLQLEAIYNKPITGLQRSQ